MKKNDLIIMLKSLLANNRITYVSVPITSGSRFIDWYQSDGQYHTFASNEYLIEKELHVVQNNVEDAKNFIQNIRANYNKFVIDPTNLEESGLNWSQVQFYKFWDEIIANVVDEIIFSKGWEYSVGCCHEYISAVKNNKLILDHNQEVLDLEISISKIMNSAMIYEKFNLPEAKLLYDIVRKLDKISNAVISNNLDDIRDLELKDEKLNALSSYDLANVAQFISFKPDLRSYPSYVHIGGYRPSDTDSTKEIIEKLINAAPSKSVNIRSFSPEVMKGNKLIFAKKLEDIESILETIQLNRADGKHSIINENIDINDGGVSGVVLGDIIEFSPEDTPKCVDKEGVCSLPRPIGTRILNTVYGFKPDLNYNPDYRVEFSIHPVRQGVKKQHTIIWEYEHYENYVDDKKITWPNRFSKFIGDKVFGLLIADALDFNVPKTTALSRKVAPFTFGRNTGLDEKWIRTCPISKEPGKFYTGFGWTDPFKLMNIEEEKGTLDVNIASIISQNAVEALYSGAAFIYSFSNDDVIEGVSGTGDKFMVGESNKEDLPDEVILKVKELCERIREQHTLIGDVSIEWVFDGVTVWIVQLNQLKMQAKQDNDSYRTIVEGNPLMFKRAYVKDGLDSLRDTIELAKKKELGIELIGNIGVTSHFGDLLRLAAIPSRLIPE